MYSNNSLILPAEIVWLRDIPAHLMMCSLRNLEVAGEQIRYSARRRSKYIPYRVKFLRAVFYRQPNWANQIVQRK